MSETGFILLVVLSPKETCQHLGTVGTVLQIYSQTLKEDTSDDSAQTIQKRSHTIHLCSHSAGLCDQHNSTDLKCWLNSWMASHSSV